MAYKFQIGSATLSGSLVQEGDLYVSSSLGKSAAVGGGKNLSVQGDATVGADVILSQNGNVYLAGDGGAAKIVSTGGNAVSIFGAKVVTNGASIEPDSDNGTDLGSSSKEFKDLYLDGIAYIDDLRADTANIDGGNIDGTIIGASSVAAGSFAAVVGTTGTFSGILKSDDTTEATSTTDGSLQTDGGLSVAKSAVIGDDLDLLSDAAILNFGADKDVNLTHVADTGVLLNSSRQLQFGDSGTYIHQSADAVLCLVSDTEIEINATTVDINGAIDASSTIVAASSITAGTSFVIGSADLNEADMEKLDGITNGTVTASKAVVVDANKDAAGFRNVSATNGTFSALTQGQLVTAGSSGLLEGQETLSFDDSREEGYLTLFVSSSASGSTEIGDGLLYVGTEDDDTLFQVCVYNGSNTEMGLFFDDNAAPAAVAVAADLMLFQDANDSKRMKKESLGDIRDLYFSAVSGDATVAAGGALTIASDAVEPSMINIFDDSLAATNTHIMIADGTDYSSFALSGDVTMTNAGVVTIANDAVESGMLNDNVISGQTELAADGLAAADELMISDAGTLKKIGVDNLFIDGPGLLTETAITVADDYFMFLDGGATGNAKKESIADLVSAMAGAGLTATNGVLSSDASPTPTDHGNANATLVEGLNFTDTDFTAARTWTLPASPDAGDVVMVKAPASAGTYNLTIARAGSQTIDGETSVVLESNYGALELVYAMNNMWVIK